MQERIEQITRRCKELFAQAEARWPHVKLSHVQLRFDLKGRAAGMAIRQYDRYTIRFNRDMIQRDAFEHIINNTVPHEIAHIVCFMDPTLGSNHDAGWARVCRTLGGSGDRTHREEVVFGRGNTYEYVTDRGHAVRVGERHHQYLQTRGPLSWRQGKGTVALGSAYKLVGIAGRSVTPAQLGKTLTEPAKTPAEQPKVAPQTAKAPRGTKADIVRSIMLSGYRGGRSYEDIIRAIQAATEFDRSLARSYFKYNADKLNIPAGFYA